LQVALTSSFILAPSSFSSSDFAGVDRFLDTSVKRYSSGMKVRLGFAVAANLEPEILIEDEVDPF
jgi:ABC-type polysaccharide/polyol phosphate transport system ATPase subunit